MSASHIKYTFVLSDGRAFQYSYVACYTPDSYYEPGDCEIHSEVFALEGDEINYEDLPKGLAHIADMMVNGDADNDGRFTRYELQDRGYLDRFDQDDYDVTLGY